MNTTRTSGLNLGVPTAILTALVCSLIVLVTFTKLLDAKLARDAILAAESEPSSESLPTKCEPFYNDGTGRWIECMGVGLK